MERAVWGHAHNWSGVRGRPHTHPPSASLFLYLHISGSPVALALLINQMVINNSNLFKPSVPEE